ncbi:hypothetical protein ACEWY4_026624 [Coilia grayii]|uniref:Immunoglobulin domain-containing protein n=1 Tax=Coilia grayii TaxID=363190 RepID=A0ABD1IQ40_9TELE
MDSAMFIMLFILFTVTEEHSTVSHGSADTAGNSAYPAQIFGQSQFKVGECAQVRCSVFDLKPAEAVYVYLCKNGVGVQSLLASSQDSTFILQRVKTMDSGNYSCMFTRMKQYYGDVKAQGGNTLIIQVDDRAYPGVIATDHSEVTSGADVDFRCTLKDAPDTGNLLAFLCRNSTINDIEMWDSKKKEAIFHRKRVQESDTGSYGCVVSDQPLAATELDTCGRNSVFLQVAADEPSVDVGLTPSTSSGATMAPLYLLPSLFLLVLLIIVLWRNGTYKCRRSHQTITDYANVNEQHVDLTSTEQYTGRRSLEARGEGSLATSFYEDAARSGAGLRPSLTATYATSMKKKKPNPRT